MNRSEPRRLGNVPRAHQHPAPMALATAMSSCTVAPSARGENSSTTAMIATRKHPAAVTYGARRNNGWAR